MTASRASRGVIAAILDCAVVSMDALCDFCLMGSEDGNWSILRIRVCILALGWDGEACRNCSTRFWFVRDSGGEELQLRGMWR